MKKLPSSYKVVSQVTVRYYKGNDFVPKSEGGKEVVGIINLKNLQVGACKPGTQSSDEETTECWWLAH